MTMSNVFDSIFIKEGIISKLRLSTKEQTISGGELSADSSFILVRGEGNSNDALHTINGGKIGDIICIAPTHEIITIQSAIGNIFTNSDTNPAILPGLVCVLIAGSYEGNISWSTIATDDAI